MAPSDPTCSLADLDGWSFPGTALAVVGHPIKHSISPAMHNAALASLAVATPRFSNWRYFRFEVHPDDLPRALDLFHAKNFHGLNLTVPHKVLAVDRVAAIEPIARPIGAINPLLHTPAGWRGHNTDGYGLAAAIRETLGLELTGVTDAGLDAVASLPNLVYLNLYGTKVTDAGIAKLAGLKHLRNLYVWQTQVTPEGVKKLEAALPGVDINTGWVAPAPAEKKEEPKK
jgi:hypothetical protein